MVIKGMAREANFFTRWMSFADNQEFLIDKRHIVTEGIVDDNVAAYYNNMMSNIEKDDEVTMGAPEDAEHPDLLDIEEDSDTPTFH